ncbi:hypothetical protein [Actinocorallia longicatena]|uniref:hypothetical protein n=1 Tax=Actinocorallia longicatena TaxID=111803 RepID=UPI0031CE6A08
MRSPKKVAKKPPKKAAPVIEEAPQRRRQKFRPLHEKRNPFDAILAVAVVSTVVSAVSGAIFKAH